MFPLPSHKFLFEEKKHLIFKEIKVLFFHTEKACNFYINFYHDTWSKETLFISYLHVSKCNFSQ